MIQYSDETRLKCTIRLLVAKDAEIARLRRAINKIVDLRFGAEVHGPDVAQEALRETE